MVQPKLKGDTVFIPLPDGIYLRNNQSSFQMKGKVIYRWIESLAPYLNGEHTLEEITAGLDTEKQAMVTDLVNTLLAHGFLKDTSQDLPHHLSPTERETYAAEIAFIDSFCDSAASRFEHFREHQVLLIGSGLTLTGLVKALLKCGLRELTIIITPECETNTRRHQEYLDLFHKGDPHQTLREINAPDWENDAEVQTILQPFDTIMHISDRPMLTRARRLNQLCATQRKNLLQAIIVDDHAWIGPLVRPDQKGCWECAWRRLQGNLTNIQAQFPACTFQDQPTREASSQATSRFVALPTAAFVANLLNFEVFKSITKAGPVTIAENLIEVDLETLRTQKHSFLPHPLCCTCHHPEPRTQAQFLETIQQLEQGKPIDQDHFSRQLAPCFETHLGLFHSLDEEDFIQLPLSVCKVVVSNPMLPELFTNPPAVLGFGTNFSSARKLGAERACEIYATSIIDRRLLLSAQTVGTGQETLIVPATPPIAPTIPAEHFLSPTPLDEVKDWTWAVDLHTGQACLVPAPLAYPVLRGLSPLSEAGLGVSSGTSWAEAISRALLKVCQHLTISQLGSPWPEESPNSTNPTGLLSYPQVELAAITLSPEGTRLLHILEHIGERVTVYDVTGPLQIPTFAICLGDQTVAYGTHITVAQALQDGFVQALLSNQLSGEQILVDNLPPVPSLPITPHGNKETVGPVQAQYVPTAPARTYDASEDWHDHKIWLQETLQKHGWRTFAVPLDHDPALRKIQPYIVHVLVARA